MSSRKKKNVIQLITRISVVGIAVITAALIILLSAFNGIEKMIEALYSEYDSDITIRPVNWKTANEQQIDFKKLKAIPGVLNYSRAIEEVVVLKHEKKWVNANLIGIDTAYLTMSKMSRHMVDGECTLGDSDAGYAIIGATLLDKLGGFIPGNVGYETVVCYIPKRKIKIRPGRNPFNMQTIQLAGRMNFNREVNARDMIVSLDQAREMLDYTNQISAVYVDVDSKWENEEVKEEVKKLVGNDFVVKTNFEKNEIIYQTSKSEKLIVFIILLFIFILAAFSLVASLTMLFVEKIENIKTMRSFGANDQFVFKIFFLEGLLIAGKGILFGALIGYAVCALQIQFSLLKMPNSNGEAFPIALSFWDGVVILSLVTGLSLLFSYLPVKFLIYKNRITN